MLIELSTDLPVVIEIPDAAERLDAVLPTFRRPVTEGLVTLEAVRIVRDVSPDTGWPWAGWSGAECL